MKQRWQAAGWAAVVTVGLASAAHADLPADVRTAAAAVNYRDEIAAYVKGLFDKVEANDKKSDSNREELCRQVEPTNILTPSSSFTSEYVSAVLAELPTLANAPEVQKRLTGALILYRICNSTPSAGNGLISAVQKVLTDKSPAVALWGVKSAGALLPPLLRVPFTVRQGTTIANGILASVQLHPTVGPLVQDAYNALYLADPPSTQPPLPPGAFGPCIDAMNKLVGMRAEAYLKNVPSYPQADRVAPAFFTRGIVIGAITPAQRQDAVQQVVDFMSAVAGQIPAATGETLADLNRNLANSAGVLNVSLLGPGNGAQGQLAVLQSLKANAPAASYASRIDDAITAIRKIKDFAALKDPPKAPAAAG